MTNADLSRSTGIDPATITRYLSGERVINDNNLRLIANCFSISVEVLTNIDFSEVIVVLRDSDVFARNIEALLPLFSSDIAKENSEFCHAYFQHMEMYVRFKKHDWDLGDDDQIEEGYQAALEDERIKAECIANLLAYYYFTLVQMSGCRYLTKGWDAVPIQVKRLLQAQYDNCEREINLLQEESGDAEKDCREILDDPEFINEMTEQFAYLKQNGWNDLADYYIALMYVWGFVSNAFSYEQNNQIGLELMEIYQKCGNKYADRYITIMFPDK